MEILTPSTAEIVRWVGQQPELALLISAAAYLLLLLLIAWTMLCYIRMARTQSRLLRGADGATLEKMLLEHADGHVALQSNMSAIMEANARNAGTLQQCLQRIGIVRYDAYGDVGGLQSFSLALLDANSSGIVITSLHSRSDMRLYAKPIVSGESTLVLTNEEHQAIAESCAGGPVITNGEVLTVSGKGNGGRRR